MHGHTDPLLEGFSHRHVLPVVEDAVTRFSEIWRPNNNSVLAVNVSGHRHSNRRWPCRCRLRRRLNGRSDGVYYRGRAFLGPGWVADPLARRRSILEVSASANVRSAQIDTNDTRSHRGKVYNAYPTRSRLSGNLI